MTDVLIAPKSVYEYTADEYHAYIKGMHEMRTRGKAKPTSPVLGLSLACAKDGTLKRTKHGDLSIKRTKDRHFEYVLRSEIAALAKHYKTNQSDVWNAFTLREFIITDTRMEAEQRYAELEKLPF